MDKIESRYQIEDCVEWITVNEYQKVVLQFSEAEMPDSVEVVKSLKRLLPTIEFYTVLTASCSVDYLAPLRLGENFIHAIICYGTGASKTNICLPSSSTAFDQLPVLFVFGSNQELFLNTKISSNDLILYDLKCMPYLHHFMETNDVREDQVGKVIRRNECWSFTKNVSSFVTSESESSTTFGHFNIKKPVEDYDKIFWIGYCDDLFYRVNLAKECICLIEPSSNGSLVKELKPRTVLSKRLALIEKARIASNIGLVFNNSIPNVDSILGKVKKLSIKKGKKHYYMSLVQEADNTKFGNFPLVEVFVIISSCTCGSLARSIKAHVPLITLTEYEIALGIRTKYGGVEWNSEEVDEESENEDVESATNNQIMEYKQLMGNSWFGLQVDAGCEPITAIKEGSRGVASTYDHEVNKSVSN